MRVWDGGGAGLGAGAGVGVAGGFWARAAGAASEIATSAAVPNACQRERAPELTTVLPAEPAREP
jgi:hypothetical protein